jgi:Ser/Thr protein kinase RdoA (MazF antagonist)
MLSDFPAHTLHATIPDFHNTPKRLQALHAAVQADTHGRVKEAGPELDAILSHSDDARLLQDAALPLRVVHNDAKLSNVLFESSGDHALCVVDLDTTMPGLVAHDVGDMLRSATCQAAEDEPDLALVKVDPRLRDTLMAGYMTEAAAFLTPSEIHSLNVAGRVIALEQAIRFLTDFLEGDRYYKTSYPTHNLVRTRNQCALAWQL